MIQPLWKKNFLQLLTLLKHTFIMQPSNRGGTVAKNVLASARATRDVGLIPGLEDPLEEDMATLPSLLAWRLPWTGEPGRL